LDNVDREIWVRDIRSTWFGNADLDGQFNSGDLVSVLALGQYEDQLDPNSTWISGDWNGDGDFTSSDLVVALADGGYEQGPRPAVSAVPEPRGAVLALWSVLAVLPVRSCLTKRRSARVWK
jgi:hypothetical protein